MPFFAVCGSIDSVVYGRALREQARPLNTLVPMNAHFNELAAMLFEKLPGLRGPLAQASSTFDQQDSDTPLRVRTINDQPADSGVSVIKEKIARETVVRQRSGEGEQEAWPSWCRLDASWRSISALERWPVRSGSASEPFTASSARPEGMPQIDAEAAATARRWPAPGKLQHAASE
jgi:hypothetical protein